MTNGPRPANVRDMINALLDRGYTRTVAPVIKAVARAGTTGVLAQRLAEFEAEATRLQNAGEALKATNPVFRALMADFTTVLRRNRALIEGLAVDVQGEGVKSASVLTRLLAVGNLSDASLATAGIVWQSPSMDAIGQIVNYTSKPAWNAALNAYESGIGQTVQQIAIRGVLEGKNPLTIARDVRFAVQGLPAHQANTMLRTLQLTAYRDADVANRVANADVIAYCVRIATLDARVCMSCIAQHGKILPVNARINDHDNGRCVAISVVKGYGRTVRTGEEWFRAQPAERQQQQMGKAAYRAWRAGEIQLNDFPKPYQSPVFGEMIREASLKDMLGDRARDFYKEAA